MDAYSELLILCESVAVRYKQLADSTGMLIDERLLWPELDAVCDFAMKFSGNRAEVLSVFQKLIDTVDYANTADGATQASLILRHCGPRLRWRELVDLISDRQRIVRDPSIYRILDNIRSVILLSDSAPA